MNERTVAIVGRPNVGKSALFNRLAGRMISIVHDQPGVTRDRIVAPCGLGSAPFDIVDTGGIGGAAEEDFSREIHTVAELAQLSAQVLLLVVDARQGVTPIDSELARLLRRSGKPVILVINKVDMEMHEPMAADFARLGFTFQLAVSAAHGRGIGELVEKIEQLLPASAPQEADETTLPPVKIALVGRPNVGKSSLINAILQDERTIVSDVAGTTRDAVDIPYRRGDQHYVLIDTAGIRSRSRHDSPVEVFSVMRSERSIRRADLCALVIDASFGVTAQDKKIAGLIQEAEKPCILLLNKWDLLKPSSGVREARESMLEEIRRGLFFLSYAPLIAVSAVSGDHLGKVFQSLDRVSEAARTRIGTGVLNRFFQEALSENPPPVRGNRRFKILYATQAQGGRTDKLVAAKIVLFVNSPDILPDSYRKYLEAKIRKDLAPLTGVPLLFELRGRAAEGAE